VQKDGRVDIRAFTFCVLSHLQTAIHRRDVFTHPSWRYADPRANLLSDAEWEATRPIVCRGIFSESQGAQGTPLVKGPERHANGRLADSGVNENHDHRSRFLAPVRAISAQVAILRLLAKSERLPELNPP